MLNAAVHDKLVVVEEGVGDEREAPPEDVGPRALLVVVAAEDAVPGWGAANSKRMHHEDMSRTNINYCISMWQWICMDRKSI